MNKALLDTDIFSEVLKRRDAAVSGRAKAYRAEFGRFTLSAASVLEVVRGLCRLGAHRQLEVLLEALEEAEVVPIDQDVAVLAGRIDGTLLARGITIGVNDVLIAATAILGGLVLVTGNTKHYERVRAAGFPLEMADWRHQPG